MTAPGLPLKKRGAMDSLISVITLTHNKLDVTRTCLTSLLGTASQPWELIVVDNGSSDGTDQWLREFRRTAAEQNVRVTIIGNPGNIGCSTARNQGIARAEGRRLVFIDNDIALRSRHWLRDMEHALDTLDRAAMVGPKLVYPYEPFDIQCAGAAVAPTGRVQFRGRGAPRNDPRFATTREVQCLISACFMVDKDAIAECGGFDEAFNPVEFEDIDLCYRIRSHGFRVYYLHSVEMYHFESVTTAGTPSLPNTRLIVKNGLLFKRRWQHMFAVENGPSDRESRWQHRPARPFADLGPLPVIE